MRPAQQPVRCEINVTPLVDVCLVLLIVFMVVTPLLVHGSAVELPETHRPDRLSEPEDQLRLAIASRAGFDGAQLVALRREGP